MSEDKRLFKESLYKVLEKGYSPKKIRKLMLKYPSINYIEITIKWERTIGEPNID